jgi:quercetin dioxygenase-like cupin family protein
MLFLLSYRFSLAKNKILFDLLQKQQIGKMAPVMIISETKTKTYIESRDTMSNKIIKNIDSAKVLALTDLVTCQEGQIVSKTLVQNSNVSLTLFAFDKGEEISTHTSHGDAMILVIDGHAEITIGEQKYQVKSGETIVMPAEVPHAVYAQEKLKFMLTVIF